MTWRRFLKSAKRPFIYAGGGVINAGASEELRQLVELFRYRRTGIEVAHFVGRDGGNRRRLHHAVGGTDTRTTAERATS